MTASIGLAADLPEAWALYAMLLSAKKDYAKAGSVCTGALQQFPYELRLLVIRACVERAAGDLDGSLKTLLGAFRIARRSQKDTDDQALSESTFSAQRSQRLADEGAPSSKGRATMSVFSDGKQSVEREGTDNKGANVAIKSPF